MAVVAVVGWALGAEGELANSLLIYFWIYFVGGELAALYVLKHY